MNLYGFVGNDGVNSWDLLGLLDREYYIGCSCTQKLFLSCSGDDPKEGWRVVSGAGAANFDFDGYERTDMREMRKQLGFARILALDEANLETQEEAEGVSKELGHGWDVAPEPRICECWWYLAEKELIDSEDGEFWLTRSVLRKGPLNNQDDIDAALPTYTTPNPNPNDV